MGVLMQKVALGRPGTTLILDHCERCGGVWFEKGEPQQLAARHTPAHLWEHIPPRKDTLRPPCHECGAPLHRDEGKCIACNALNELDCPVCEAKMARIQHGTLTVDACAKCKGVWFDHAELKSVWSLSLENYRKNNPSRAAEFAAGTGDVLLESFFWYPGLAIDIGHGIGHAASAVASSGAIEVVGNAAEGVFDFVAGIIGSIFDG